MLILLPPSEAKTAPARGRPLDLASLSSPALTQTRRDVLDALVTLSQGDRKEAMERLGLGPTQSAAVARNALLEEAPCARADEVYTGVLYSTWDPAGRLTPARRHAEKSVAICSALFGLLRPSDLIPSYRLSSTVNLPPLGPIAALWRRVLGPELLEQVGDGLLVDLRSGPYRTMSKSSKEIAERTVTVRVLRDVGGQRSVVSHFNKAIKGQLVRELLASGLTPKSIKEFGDDLRDLGWQVEGEGNQLDVVVSGT